MKGRCVPSKYFILRLLNAFQASSIHILPNVISSFVMVEGILFVRFYEKNLLFIILVHNVFYKVQFYWLCVTPKCQASLKLF